MNIAIVPVKHKSERVKNKNFRPFYDRHSLLEIKIKQLISEKIFDRIVISSNSNLAKNIAKKYNCNFILREDKFSNNIIAWSDVITTVVKSVNSKKNDNIFWCHVTSPLFNQYKKAFKKYQNSLKKGFDSLVAVNKFSGFLLNENLYPVNYNWGKWHNYSQYLPNYYNVNGALFINKTSTILDLNYLIGKKPDKFLCNDDVSIDIDNEFDFEIAKLIFKKKISNRKLFK
jgi:CMP-N-acetylneuraminic acid synthetase